MLVDVQYCNWLCLSTAAAQLSHAKSAKPDAHAGRAACIPLSPIMCQQALSTLLNMQVPAWRRQAYLMLNSRSLKQLLLQTQLMAWCLQARQALWPLFKTVQRPLSQPVWRQVRPAAHRWKWLRLTSQRARQTASQLLRTPALAALVQPQRHAQVRVMMWWPLVHHHMRSHKVRWLPVYKMQTGDPCQHQMRHLVLANTLLRSKQQGKVSPLLAWRKLLRQLQLC
jgi:hypothetical protein